MRLTTASVVRELGRGSTLAKSLPRRCFPAARGLVRGGSVTGVRPKRRVIGAVSLLLALTLVACGGDDEGEEPAAGGTSTTSESTSTTSAVTTISAAPGTTVTRPAQTLECDTVAFTPNSEDAASSITATGLTCDEAEDFVRIAGSRTSSGGPAQLDVEGYRCVRVRSTEDPLPQAFYECTSGAKRVTFVRT